MGGALMAAIIEELLPLPDTERAATQRPMELSRLLNPPRRRTERLFLLEAVLGTGKRKRPPPRSGGDADGLDAPIFLLGSLVAVEEADKWRRRLLAAPSSLMMDALAELLCKQALGDDAEIDEGAAEVAAATRGTAALIGQPIGLPSCSAAPPAPPARSVLWEYLLPKAFSKAVVSEAIVERLGTADAWEEASAREMAVARGVGDPIPYPYPYPSAAMEEAAAREEAAEAAAAVEAVGAALAAEAAAAAEAVEPVSGAEAMDCGPDGDGPSTAPPSTAREREDRAQANVLADAIAATAAAGKVVAQPRAFAPATLPKPAPSLATLVAAITRAVDAPPSRLRLPAIASAFLALRDAVVRDATKTLWPQRPPTATEKRALQTLGGLFFRFYGKNVRHQRSPPAPRPTHTYDPRPPTCMHACVAAWVAAWAQPPQPLGSK
jgi:hypothetical protein